MQWLTQNWINIAIMLGIWASIATALNRSIWPKPLPTDNVAPWKRLLHTLLIDLPAFLPSINFKGLFGLPVNVPFLSVSQPVPIGETPKPLPTQWPPAGTGLLLALTFSSLLSACGYNAAEQAKLSLSGFQQTITALRTVEEKGEAARQKALRDQAAATCTVSGVVNPICAADTLQKLFDDYRAKRQKFDDLALAADNGIAFANVAVDTAVALKDKGFNPQPLIDPVAKLIVQIRQVALDFMPLNQKQGGTP